MSVYDLKKLLKLIEGSSLPISELEVKDEKNSIRVSLATHSEVGQVVRAEESRSPAVPTPPEDSVIQQANDIKSIRSDVDVYELKSPMVGTVYLTPSPEADPFVTVGQKVQVGETLCLIEAMKMYNKIKTDKAGVIQACLVDDGQPVEYEQPLFLIE